MRRIHATADFWYHYRNLPIAVQKAARRAYLLWRDDPYHPGLHFKRLNTKSDLFSVRVGAHYRALALVDDDVITWFWIGSHADYDHLISQN